MSKLFKLFLPGFLAISCFIAAIIIIAVFVVAPFYEEKKDINHEMLESEDVEISEETEQKNDAI